MKRKKHYGLLNFVLDVIMFSLTAGLWTIWIVIREMQMFGKA